MRIRNLVTYGVGVWLIAVSYIAWSHHKLADEATAATTTATTVTTTGATATATGATAVTAVTAATATVQPWRVTGGYHFVEETNGTNSGVDSMTYMKQPPRYAHHPLAHPTHHKRRRLSTTGLPRRDWRLAA